MAAHVSRQRTEVGAKLVQKSSSFHQFLQARVYVVLWVVDQSFDTILGCQCSPGSFLVVLSTEPLIPVEFALQGPRHLADPILQPFVRTRSSPLHAPRASRSRYHSCTNRQSPNRIVERRKLMIFG